MGSLGFPCYRPLGWMNWAPVLGLRQEPGRFTGSAYKSSFNLAFLDLGSGSARLFFKHNHVKKKKTPKTKSLGSK